MKKFGGWNFPDGEEHLIGWMRQVNDLKNGRHRYQGKKYDAMLAFCKQQRTCIDVGAHVGLFSYWLSQDFQRVESFEPVPAQLECFRENVLSENVNLHPCAVGEAEGLVTMFTAATSSGDSWVENGAKPDNVEGSISDAGQIPMHTIDSFNLHDVDCMKLDTEGYELFALRGAAETIKRYRPCIMVEQKTGRAVKYGLKQTEAVDYLKSLGYKLRKEISGDFIMTFE